MFFGERANFWDCNAAVECRVQTGKTEAALTNEWSHWSSTEVTFEAVLFCLLCVCARPRQQVQTQVSIKSTKTQKTTNLLLTLANELTSRVSWLASNKWPTANTADLTGEKWGCSVRVSSLLMSTRLTAASFSRGSRHLTAQRAGGRIQHKKPFPSPWRRTNRPTKLPFSACRRFFLVFFLPSLTFWCGFN